MVVDGDGYKLYLKYTFCETSVRIQYKFSDVSRANDAFEGFIIVNQFRRIALGVASGLL